MTYKDGPRTKMVETGDVGRFASLIHNIYLLLNPFLTTNT